MAKVGQTLTAANDLQDEDGLGTITYRWFADNQEIGQGATYQIRAADKGKTLTVKAEYTDGKGHAETVESAKTAPVSEDNTPQPPQNHAPMDIALSASAIAEGKDGATVGKLTTTDPDAGDRHTYTVNDSRFEVASDGTLKLKAGQHIDYASEKTINLTVTATDAGGLSTQKTFTLSVQDDPNYPTPQPQPPQNHAPTNIALSESQIAEGKDGATVGKLTTTDPDAGDRHTYAVSDARFEVAADGTLKLKAGQHLDYAAEKTIDLTVTATDAGGLSTQKTFTLQVQDAPNYPTPQPQPNQPGTVEISGAARVGETLSAKVSDADGVPADIRYQWFADSTPIAGATAPSFTLTAAEAGKVITVRALYTDNAQHAEDALSAATAPVADATPTPPPAPNHAGTVTISGKAVVDEVLTATVSDADGLPDAAQVQYQWFADGQAIAGATGAVFLLTAAQKGAKITVQARYADKAGHPEAPLSAETDAVADLPAPPPQPQPNQPGTVVISGVAQVGETLTATVSDGDGVAQGKVSYQWLRDGQPIASANGKSYPLQAADVGHKISVQASYQDNAQHDESPTSAQTDSVADTPAPAPQPQPNQPGTVVISGVAKVGETLLATVNDADGVPATGVKYQWFADGKAISGATGQTFTLTAAQKGAKITVQATYDDNAKHHESPISSETQAVSEDAPPAPQPEQPNAPGITLSGSHEVTEGGKATYTVSLDQRALPQANSASELLHNLQNQKGILFGQQRGLDVSFSPENSDGNHSDVYALSGHYPGMIGLDMMEPPRQRNLSAEENGRRMGEAMRKIDSIGGIPTLSAHWNMPGGETDRTKIDLKRLLPGGDQNAELNGWLDAIVETGKHAVRDDGTKIPFLFRPLHEANGDWMWWNYERSGAETYKELFRYIVNYLKEHGLEGQMLTTFAPNGGFGGDESRYKLLYPGDDVVDVLGMDFYDTDNTRLAKDKWAGELVQDLAMLSRMAAARGKIAALAEFGREGYKMLKPDGNTDPNWYTDVLEAIKADPDASKIAFMHTWANFGGNPVFSAFTPWPGHKMAGNFNEFVRQLTMTRNADRDVTVDVTIQHGTTDDGDVKTTTHTVTIPKGQNSATFTVNAVADGKKEGDEHYTVKISNAQGGQIEAGKDSVSTTIHDEGSAGAANHPGSITITGEATEDSSLTATVADEDGVPNGVAYQWLRDGTAIDGAHDKTYVLRGDDVGHKISVQARYTDNAAHDEAPTSSETAAVERKPAAPPPANQPGIVNIRGEAKIGSELSAEVRDGNGYDANSVQYQWLRDGQPIAGATHGNYTLQAEDAGHKISVRAAYTDGDKYRENPTSATTEIAAADPHAGVIAVTGAAKVGAILTTAITDADGVPKVGIHYQWFADGKAIEGATHEVYRIRPDDIGKHISVQASYTDNGGHAETTNTAAVVQNVAANPATQSAHGHKLYAHEEFGKYIDARDFGVNPANADNTAALKAALKAADDEGAALYLGAGTLKLHEQIRIGADVHDKSGKLIQEGYENVRAIFGAGAGETHLTFDWQQTEGERFYPRAKDDRFNPWNNRTNVNPYAAILIDGVNGKSVADLSLEYQHKTAEDFYQKTKSYFGLINGIIVNDADHTKIDTVEISGMNRAGVYFTSTLAESSGARDKLKTHQISEADAPTGDNNQLIYSNLHHNRVAGALVAFQKNFTADSNHLAWNGHEADGGTGYGIASMAGSYGFGITYSRNTTDHNYRKGLDIHDGNHITIENNTLNGDRLYGIGVYNRQFTMDDVTIRNNHITADPKFRLATDDGDEIAGGTPNYHLYSGIQIQTNTQPLIQDLQSKGPGKFDISDNTISGLEIYQNGVQTYGIEFRNHEPTMNYALNISGNHISGESSKYLIGILNQTQHKNGSVGAGSGDITIENNTMELARSGRDTAPIYLEEKGQISTLRGSVKINHNALTLREASEGATEAIAMHGNAKTYDVGHNTFELHGNVHDRPVVRINGSSSSAKPHLNLHDNTFQTEDHFDASWLKYGNASIETHNNTLNGKALVTAGSPYQHETPQLLHDHDGYHLNAETALHYPLPAAQPAKHAPYDSLETDKLHELLETHGNEHHAAPAHAPYDSLEANKLHELLGAHGGANHEHGATAKTAAPHYDATHQHNPVPHLPQEDPYTIL